MGGGPEAGRFLGLGDDITLASVCLTSWDRLGDDPGCQQRSVACRDGTSGKRQLFDPAMPLSSSRRSMWHSAKTRFRGPGWIMLFDDGFGIASQKLRSTPADRRIAVAGAVRGSFGRYRPALYIPDSPSAVQSNGSSNELGTKPVLSRCFVAARQPRWWDCSLRKAQCIPCRRGFALWSAQENKGGYMNCLADAMFNGAWGRWSLEAI
jgi:hypothetical protein